MKNQIISQKATIQSTGHRLLYNGRKIEVLMSGSPIFNSKGDIINIVEFIRLKTNLPSEKSS